MSSSTIVGLGGLVGEKGGNLEEVSMQNTGCFKKLGRIPVLKAWMNSDLHMAGDLKSTASGNLSVVFGKPDIALHTDADGRLRVEVKGVDVFDPSTGEIRSDGPDGIACWFIDSDYNGESFFVRHVYFLGQNDPYSAFKTTLKAEINEEAWRSLKRDVSRAFERPETGRIAVKVINHLGDEVMKVFRVSQKSYGSYSFTHKLVDFKAFRN